MKDDANLICPLCYEDPFSLWPIINLQRDLTDLRDVTWKSPISSTYITIDKLPLRFLRSDANLFKDTEHSFRWFLAAYVSLYLITADSLEAYKTAKIPLKKWIDQNASQKRTPWLVIYCPTAIKNIPMDTCNKIYSRLSNDFYIDRPGDRSVMLITKPDATIPVQNKPKESRFLGSPENSFSSSLMLSISSFSTSSMSVSTQGGGDIQLALTSFQELLSKLREGVVQSFQYRTAAYDADIRRLEAARSSAANYDFRQLFLVKESLALMYQMMQLADKALVQYEELEDLIHSVSNGSITASNSNSNIHNSNHNSNGGEKPNKVSTFQLPDTDWPMVAPELLSTADLPSTSKAPSKSQADVPTFSSPPIQPPANPIGTEEKDKDKDKDVKNDPSRNLMSDACKNGDDVLSYSINVARLKILKNKMSSLELLRYIFARQMHLLGQLERPVTCAEKSMRFMHFSFTFIMKRLQEKFFVTNNSTVKPSPSSASSNNTNPPEAVSYELRTAQCHVWSLSASIKLLKLCRELILRLYRDGADKGLRESVAGQDRTNLYIPSSSFSSSSSSSAVTAAIMSAVDNEHTNTNTASLVAPPVDAGSSRSSDDAVFLVQQFGNLPQPLKDSSAALGELLSFAVHCLHKLCPTLLDCKRLSSDFIIHSAQSQDTHSGLRIRVTKSGITAECVEQTVPVLDEGVHQIRSNEFRLFLDHDLYLSGLGPNVVNMDQVLSFAAHKVRSLSHFWAKMRLSTGSSLRKTAADFPLDPGYLSYLSADGEYLLPIINIGVDQGGKIALSRYEKGRALELSLAILLTSVHAEMMTWADRSRSTACLQIKVCDYLLSGGLYGRVLSLYEKGGPELVEQVVERESISLGLPIIVRFSHSAGDSVHPISVERHVPTFCLPFIRFANLGRVETGLLAGGVGFGWWAELCFWQLSKLFYCASQLKAWDKLRQISSFLLTMIDDVQLRNRDSVKGFLFTQLLLLLSPMETTIDNVNVISVLHRNLSIPTLKSTEILQFPSILTELATSFKNPFSLLVLPLRKYFSFEIVTHNDDPTVQSELSLGSASLSRLKLVTGKIKLAGLEEGADDAEYSYDVHAFRFKAGESKSYCLYLSLLSLLPIPFSAEDITVTYSNLLNLEYHGDASTQLPDIVIRACSAELPEVIIRPGKQKIPLNFHPELAGDYYLNRVTICRGTHCFVFQQQLPELSSVYEKEATTAEDPSPAYAFADSGGQHRARGAGFKNYSFLHRLGSYPFLKIHSPDNPLNLRGFYPTLSPLEGEDCMLLYLETHNEDAVSDLTIDAYAKANASISSSYTDLQTHFSPVRFQQLAVKSIDPLEDDAKRIKAEIFPVLPPSNRYLSPAVREKRESLRLKQAFHQNRIRFQCGELQVRYSSPELSFDDAVPMLSLSPHDAASTSVNESNMEIVSSFRYSVSNLLSGRTAQLNLKFQTYKNGDDQEDQDDEEEDDDSDEKMQFTVFLNITGLLQRRGCVYRFQQTCSCDILCLQAIKVAVVNADTDVAPFDRGHFLQSVVHNQSGMQIRLLGYAFHPQVTKDATAASSLTVSEGPPFIQNMSHLVVSDLLRSSSGFNNVLKEEGVMLSAARDEDYFAAFLVHEAGPLSHSPSSTETNRSLWELSILYEFCDDQELEKKVSAPRRFFQAKASLCTPGTARHRQEDDVQLDFLSLFILPAKSASNITSTQLNVWVGSAIFVSYTLRLRVRQSPSLLLHGQDESDESNSRMIVTATVCQTSSLIVIGHYRHNLTDSIKRQLSTSSPTSSRCNDVEVSLNICLLPARAGLLQLPPLRIQAYYQHGSGRKGKEVSFMCHPNLVGRGLHSFCAVGEHESINQFICISIPT